MDDVTVGGIPKGRPALVFGGAGSGMTLFTMEFLVNRAIQYDEHGVFMAVEETVDEPPKNVTSLGFDLKDLISIKKLMVEYVQVERCEIVEAGGDDLSGLFIHLNHAIDTLGAKREELETIETHFGGFSNYDNLRLGPKRKRLSTSNRVLEHTLICML
jgi:circadian clock protein KaiC